MTFGFSYADYEYFVAASQLVLAMLGMGATLSLSEFRAIARWPLAVLLVLLLQYVGCPLLATLLTRASGLEPGIAVGLLVVAAMPSGVLSNIYTYLGRGNLPFSIAATVASTFVCLLVTPLVLRVFAAADLPSTIHMPAARILTDIACYLLIPLTVGMIVAYNWPHRRLLFARYSIRGSLVFLAVLVIGSLTSGRIDVTAYGWRVPFILVLYGLLQIGPLQLAMRALGLNADDAFTLAIEVTMRNCNVAIMIKATVFPAVAATTDPVGDAVLFVALFYGGATLVLGSLPIVWRRCTASSLERKNDDSYGSG